MREITLIKTDIGRNKRLLKMIEVINEKGICAKAEKIYKYFVKEINDPNKLFKLINHEEITPKKPRRVFIKRNINKKTGVGQTTYRTTGQFLVVRGHRLFGIVFLHSIQFNILQDNL